MDLNPAIRIIKQYEGLRLAAYRPPEGTENGYAIGYGYTRPWVTKYCIISEAWADELLHGQLRLILGELQPVLPGGLNSNQLSAVVSLAYNIGAGAFKTSTLLKKLKAGDFVAAGVEFSRWTKANGEELPGLVKRRAAERLLFETPMVKQ